MSSTIDVAPTNISHYLNALTEKIQVAQHCSHEWKAEFMTFNDGTQSCRCRRCGLQATSSMFTKQTSYTLV